MQHLQMATKKLLSSTFTWVKIIINHKTTAVYPQPARLAWIITVSKHRLQRLQRFTGLGIAQSKQDLNTFDQICFWTTRYFKNIIYRDADLYSCGS